ncbi:MAG: nucleotidyltransferase family protein [Anaerolineae bacterium]|nr:nucleotidyltransferase family protein [Anaerolineae bacterium]
MSSAPTTPLITLAALVSGQRDPHTIPGSAWPEIINAALENRLAPVLWWTVSRAELNLNTIPGWQAVVQRSRRTAISYTLLMHTQAQVNTALAAANIPALWLKGIALAHMIYPQPTLRPMSDLDVLIPYEQRRDALAVVEGLGYQHPDPHKVVSGFDDSQMHHYVLIGGGNIIIELHHQLASRDVMPDPAQTAWFWTQTQPLTVENAGPDSFLTLTPTAHLLHLCTHSIAQHGEGQVRLQQHFDVHLLITNEAINWPLVIDQAVELKWTYAVERALTLVSRLFGTPVPKAVITALHTRRPSGEDVSTAVRLREPDSRWVLLRRRLRRLPPQQRLVLVAALIFPSRTYMQNRYHIPPGRMVWPYYPYRWFDQGRGVARSLYNAVRFRLSRRQTGTTDRSRRS